MQADLTKGPGVGAQTAGDLVVCLPVSDDDIDGVRLMYQASIQRAMHDACGATVVAPTEQMQLRYATDAWNFLYSNAKVFRDDRWLACELAGVDAEAFEHRMVIAAIPHPTYETIKQAWSNLELAYWRLQGSKGEPPEARPERIDRPKRERSRTVKPRRSYVPKPRRGNMEPSNPILPRRDRRDAGQPHPPTLLFSPKPGMGGPVFPTYPQSPRVKRKAGASQSAFDF